MKTQQLVFSQAAGFSSYWDDSGKARVVLRIMSLGLRMTF